MAKWLIRVLCSLAVLAVFPGVSAAGELTVFGPKQYLRTTADTNVYEDQFSAQVGPGQIEITIGNPDGTNRVSSARVFLNGLKLLGPEDFPNKDFSYQFPVNLTENNFLRVEIQGTPGDFLTIWVTQEDNTRTITASAGSNGTISPSGAVSVNYGASQTFSITPATNYHVADVLVDGVSVGAVTSYTFTNVTANHTIAASFAIDTRTITASAGSNGTISPSGAVSVNYGASQTFSITPAANYHVADVLVDGVSVGAVTSYTFTNVTANHTIAASFAIDTRTITASAGSNGTISPSGAVSVNYGANQTFSITPAANYHVADVLVDGVSVGAVTNYTFTNVTANHTIAASFAIDTRTITASAGSNGTISPAGAVSVNYGASQTFTITPAANYHVADVLVDGVSVGAVTNYTFTNVTANHTIAASFAIDTHTITASAGSNGTISPSGAVSVNYGASQTFSITPDGQLPRGGRPGGRRLSGGGDQLHLHQRHRQPHHCRQLCHRHPHHHGLSRVQRHHLALGAVSVNYGASQTFSITPAANYHVADVLVDGVSVGAVTSYTFTNVTANHTIAASFAIDTHTITASAGANGTISPSGTVSVNYGASQTFTITPAANYHVADVLVDGASVGAVTSYTFTNVTANHTIARQLCHRHPHHHGLGRGQRDHLALGGGVGELRDQPDLQHHPRGQLPRGRRPGGRRLRGGA